MRLLANENIPGIAVSALAADRHDLVWVRTVAPGAPDIEVLAWAARESRILLTFDKDFGELARTAKLPASCGVVLFPLPAAPPAEIGPRIAAIVAPRGDWAGHFSVVERGRVRMRPLETV
jgi:hypothetical protein